MISIQWLGHAAFLIQTDTLRIITDPYNPRRTNLLPITTPADVVIRSSDDDQAHCHTNTIPSGFDLVTATEIVDTGATVRDLPIQAIWAQESLIYKDRPSDNAMYRFDVEGITISHMGDVGNPLTSNQMAALAGTDILLALTGGPPTIELTDLYQVVSTVKPKVVIPMHYHIPGIAFPMLPVTEFTRYFADTAVDWFDTHTVKLTADDLPIETRVWVLQPTLHRSA